MPFLAMPGLPALLKERTFALLWLVEIIAISAGHISHLALPIIGTTVLHASPSQMGLLIACQALPFGLLSLPSGVWVDRFSKLKLLIGTFIFLLLSLAVVPIVWWFDALSMTVLYAVGFAIGASMTLFGVAHQVLVTHVVGRPRLVDAYRIISTSESIIRLAAPGIAGLLIEWMGAPKAITIEVMVLVFATVLFAQIKEPASARIPSTGKEPMWTEIKVGLRYVWRDPALRAIAIVAALWQILFHGFLAMQILFATRVLGMSAGQIGLVAMAGGAGALLAAMVVKHANARYGPGNVLAAGLTLTTISWLGFSVLPSAYPWNMVGMATALFVFDVGAVAFFINYISMRQILTPDALLGRVTATMRFAAVAMAPLGAYATGWLAEAVGLRWTLATLGVLGLGVCVRLATYHPVRDASEQALKHGMKADDAVPVQSSIDPEPAR
jgi:predicted MFS family arabinose efflux permease